MPTKRTRTIFFSYSSKTPSPSQPTPVNTTLSSSIMAQNIQKAESVIKKWDLEEGSDSYCRIDRLFSGDRTEAQEFLKSVSNLRTAMQLILMEDPYSVLLVRAHSTMEIAMKRLQKEFHRILSANRANLDAESVSITSYSLASARPSTSDFDDVSEDEIQSAISPVSEMERALEIAMVDLKSIADAMISTGYGKECVTIYKSIRKLIVDESLHHLGVEKLSPSQIRKMDWETIEIKIKSWISAVKPAVTRLFQREKILCEHVLSASPIVPESCFADIISDGARNLLEFPENIAKCKKLTGEKLFPILDLYEALSELWSEIESIFSYESVFRYRSLAVDSMVRLNEATRYILAEFEGAIQKNASKSVPGGAVHPLTQYVMNYMIVLSDHSGILSDILADSQLSARSPLPDSYFSSPLHGGDPASLLSLRFAWIILLLLCKLDVKAELYNEVALSYLFLANNLNYVLSKVRNSNLKILLGDEWLANHETKVKQFVGNYERTGWGKAMSSLVNPTAEISAEELRESIGKFSNAFEEAYRKQKSWAVPEWKLREEIRESLTKKLGPAYRVVYDEYMSKMKGGADVQYAPDDLGNYLSDLFYGDDEGSVGFSSSTSSSPSGSGRPRSV